jgi:hypothetical protein
MTKNIRSIVLSALIIIIPISTHAMEICLISVSGLPVVAGANIAVLPTGSKPIDCIILAQAEEQLIGVVNVTFSLGCQNAGLVVITKFRSWKSPLSLSDSSEWIPTHPEAINACAQEWGG